MYLFSLLSSFQYHQNTTPALQFNKISLMLSHCFWSFHRVFHYSMENIHLYHRHISAHFSIHWTSLLTIKWSLKYGSIERFRLCSHDKIFKRTIDGAAHSFSFLFSKTEFKTIKTHVIITILPFVLIHILKSIVIIY